MRDEEQLDEQLDGQSEDMMDEQHGGELSEKPHVHVLEDGTVITHTHDDHSHGAHGHTHSHAQTKAVLNRLSRAIGHMESIRRMVEEGRDCTEVLVQLSAVKSAINNTGKIILQDHIEHCIVDAVEHGDREAIKELERAIDRFIK
jgi:DNA-binding FrmR family transcriptional regulator